jgi:exosortase
MQNTETSGWHGLALLRDPSTLALAFKASVIGVAVFALYYQDFRLIFTDALQNEATNYVLVIPFIFAYFLYRKRKMLRTVASIEPSKQSCGMKGFSEVAGLFLCTASVVLYWYGSYTFTPLEYHVLTLPLFTAGLVLALFNMQTLREMIFPVVFLIFLTPPPSTILYGTGSTLSAMAAEVSNALVAAVGIPSRISSQYGNPTIIITRPDATTMGFTLDIACSGAYQLIGFVVFAFLTAYIIRDRTWKKASIFLLGLPLIYLLNIVRVTCSLIIGYRFGEQFALQVFHLIGGLSLMVVGVVILLAASEKLFKTQIFRKTTPPRPCPSCNSGKDLGTSFCESCGRLLKYPVARLRIKDLAKMAAVAAAVAVLVSIQVPVFALTKGPAQVITQTLSGQVGNAQILPQIPNYSPSFAYRDTGFEQTAGQDASLLYLYTPLNSTGNLVWVGVEVASARSSLHPWEVCLVTWPQTLGRQPSVRQLDLRDTQIQDNPPIIARYFAFEYTKNNETQVVLYWYETSTFMVNGTAEQKEVEMSLISYPETPQDTVEAENALLPFARTIANYWQPITTWAPLALALSQNGPSLAPLVLSLLAGTMIINMIKKRKFRSAKTEAYSKLSEEDREMIHMAWQTREAQTVTPPNMANVGKGTSNPAQTQEAIFERLKHAQEIGLINGRIINRDDEPIRTWTANFKPTT